MANQTKPTTKAINENTPKKVREPVVLEPVGAVYHNETTPLKELLMMETIPVTISPKASKTTFKISTILFLLSRYVSFYTF